VSALDGYSAEVEALAPLSNPAATAARPLEFDDEARAQDDANNPATESSDLALTSGSSLSVIPESVSETSASVLFNGDLDYSSILSDTDTVSNFAALPVRPQRQGSLLSSALKQSPVQMKKKEVGTHHLYF
jgi:hypothetical protein